MDDDWTNLIEVNIDDIKKLPSTPAVYFLLYDNELTYIGQTKNLRTRIHTHNVNYNPCIRVGNTFIISYDTRFNKVLYVSAPDDLKERIALETFYISKYFPKLNDFSLFYETIVLPSYKKSKEKSISDNLINKSLDGLTEFMEKVIDCNESQNKEFVYGWEP